jgi:hypothetical protein
MVTRNRFALAPLLLAALPAACDVSATAPPSTGGVRGPSGTVVLLTDFMSTQIALSALDGTTQSPSFLSTASLEATKGAEIPFYGDVLLPRQTPPSGRVVLIDSTKDNVITWADPMSGKVQAQLNVTTGFDSDAWDYLEVDSTRAYVSRWNPNGAPGAQPFDSGSDLLIIDTMAPAITGSIPMPVEQGLPPRPSSMVQVGNTVVVVLQRTSQDFLTVGESALVGVENDAIAWEVHVTGMQTCDRPMLSPSGTQMAMGCEGQLDMNGAVTNTGATGILVYDVTSLPPRPPQRFAVVDQLGSPVQNGVTWVSETMLLGKTQTPYGGATNNQAFTLDLTTGKTTVLLTAGTNAMGMGKGLVYGDVLCRPGHGDVCLLADQDVGKLRRWDIVGGALMATSDVTVDPTTGLPPSLLGTY